MWTDVNRILSAIIIFVTAVFSQDIQTKIACEYDSLRLECNKGEIIKIETATFGRTSVSICGLEGNINCHAQGALDIIKKRCDKLQSCNVKASTDVFGEPCVGTHKYLEVSYSCVKGPKCKRNELVCHDGTCITNRKICDGMNDCVGGEDEHECRT